MLESLKCHCNELGASRDELKASVHEFMTESRKLHGTVEQQARLKPHCCLGAQRKCVFCMGTLGLSWTLYRMGKFGRSTEDIFCFCRHIAPHCHCGTSHTPHSAL